MTIKITDLPTVGTLDLADLVEIVDVSDPSASVAGTSKKVTVSVLRGPTPTYALTDLTDVAVSTPQANELLIYNGAAWVNGVLGALAYLDTVDTNEIAPLAITTAKIEGGAVTWNKLADGAATTPKIGNLAVTTEKIAPDAVTTEKIPAAIKLRQPVMAGYGVASGGWTLVAGTLTLNMKDYSDFVVTLDQDVTTWVFNTPPAAPNLGKVSIRFVQDVTGNWSVAAPTGTEYAAGVEYDVTKVAGAKDEVVLLSRDAFVADFALYIVGQDVKAPP